MDWFVAEHYALGRLLFQRGLAVLYVVAFLSAANQSRALLGTHGLLPIPAYLRRTSFRRAPSVFHLHYSDQFFAVLAWAGVALSAGVVAGLTDVVPWPVAVLVWLLLWLLYLSIVNVGQRWYGFGWESLLLEAGFLAVFLGNDDVGVPLTVLVLLRWLLFRLEFGAGMIKIRGDSCWRNLTCLYYHHETQPMPGPLSWWFHHLPKPLHKVEVAANHVTQLVVPFGLFAPQPVSGVAAGIMIVTQLWLVASGNFSWLNWAAIVLAFSVLPDSFLERLQPDAAQSTATPILYVVPVLVVTAVMLVLSWWPARNLLSHSQLMNASFNRFHLGNTYGAFGSVTRVRHEIVLEGAGPDGVWREYEFKGKPGDVRRLPRQFAPYHLRLDWLMWFAALSRQYADRWFLAMVAKLLANDTALLKLLRHNPFPAEPPAQIRALLYRYRFTTWSEHRATGDWWHRSLVGEYLPPISSL